MACDPLLEMFRRMFLYLKMEFAGKVLVKAYDKGEIGENKKELKKAFARGLRFRLFVLEPTMYSGTFLCEWIGLGGHVI